MPVVLGNRRLAARKRHCCDSCGRAIEPGTSYERQRCVDGGDAWTYKAHPACLKASSILLRLGIEGDDGALLNVTDMDLEDRAAVYREDPGAYRAAWPDAPVPGCQPAVVGKGVSAM